jgi:hypothetical protein
VRHCFRKNEFLFLEHSDLNAQNVLTIAVADGRSFVGGDQGQHDEAKGIAIRLQRYYC